MKRILSVCLSVLFLLTALPLGAVSVAAATSGITGDCTWTLDADGQLTISGNGAMADYDGDCGPWGDNIISVTIEEGVTTIGKNAFFSCNDLMSVNMSDSVTTISAYAFAECTFLGQLTMGHNVTYIGKNAFSSCISLIDLAIPSGITVIEGWTFAGCESLEVIILPASVAAIGNHAFYECYNLTVVEYAGSKADRDAMWIGEGNEILSDATWHCSMAETPSSPGNPEDITDYLEYTISNGEVTITGYKEGLPADVMIPATIEGYPVTTIEEYAFMNCESLQTVILGDNITMIGESAFRSCLSLTSVTIPDSVTTIEEGAFWYCTALISITVDANNPCYSSAEGVLFNKDQTTLIQCPGNKMGEYVIPNCVTTIKNQAFFGCNTLESVIIGDNVTTIGEGAFDRCASLATVTVGDSVTTIEAYAFSDCDLLTSMTLPDSVATIGYRAFSDCDALESVTIPNSVITITWEAFYCCRALTSVTIPDGITTIGNGTFYYCTSLESVTIPDSVTVIENWAFYGCPAVSDVYYGGTEADHAAMSIGEYNDDIISATWHYSGTDIPAAPSEPWVVTNVEFLEQSLRSDEIRDYAQARVDITYSDGETIRWDCTGGVKDDLGTYHIYETYSVPKAEWTAGNTYTVYATVWVGDTLFTGTYSFTVLAQSAPIVQSVEIAPLHKLEGQHGYTVYEDVWDETLGIYVEKSYTYYDEIHPEYTNVTITLEDGTVFYGPGFEWNGEWYGIQIESQSYANRLLPGSNEWQFSLAGYEGTYIIVIEGTPSEPGEMTGTTGDCTWTLDANGHLTISGNGAMADYEWGETPWGTAITSVIIEDGVTTIGDNAFRDCDALTAVMIGEDVATIGWSAFRDSDALETIAIPASVTTIEGAFLDCHGLSAFYVAEDNTQYSSEDGVLFNKDKTTLMQCPAIKFGKYVVPDCVTTIEGSAFEYCTDLSEVVLGSNVTLIGRTAFYHCTSLTAITIPISVKEIWGGAFIDCPALTDVYYGGTEADRAAMAISGENSSLRNATWHYAESSVTTGDTNGDGKINVRDLALLERHINGWDVEIVLDACDANGDGKVNVRDLAMIERYINGWDVEFI